MRCRREAAPRPARSAWPSRSSVRAIPLPGRRHRPRQRRAENTSSSCLGAAPWTATYRARDERTAPTIRETSAIADTREVDAGHSQHLVSRTEDRHFLSRCVIGCLRRNPLSNLADLHHLRRSITRCDRSPHRRMRIRRAGREVPALESKLRRPTVRISYTAGFFFLPDQRAFAARMATARRALAVSGSATTGSSPAASVPELSGR